MSEQPLFTEEQQNPLNPKINIKYHKASVYKKVFARLFDLLLAVAIGLSIFLGIRALVLKIPYYASATKEIDQMMDASGIYEDDESAGKISIVKKHSSDANMSAREKTEFYEERIDVFLSFVKEEAGEESYQMVVKDYDDYRLSKNYLQVYYFVEDENHQVVKNPKFVFEDVYSLYSKNVYEPFITERLQGHMNSLFPRYIENQKKLSRAVYLVEVPLSAFLSVFLVMVVPGLIFKRGRQTFGMMIYHISLANNDLLYVPTGKYIGYSFIRVLAIYVLSFYTLGVSLIIDISMMAFSKQKQDFGEYMLGIFEIDTSTEKIYLSKIEISQEHAHNAEISDKFKAIDGN